MRATGVRRPPGGTQADHRGGRALTPTTVYSAHLPGTALGTLRLWATSTGIRRLGFHARSGGPRAGEAPSAGTPPAHVVIALEALRAYLAGKLREFHIPLDLDRITPFQRRVYDRLLEVPYGHVITYGQIAADVGGEPRGARAVGQAVGANPVPIIIPCHRVVAWDGRLSGFGGGLARKAMLLGLEGIEVDGARATSRVRPEVLRLPL